MDRIVNLKENNKQEDKVAENDYRNSPRQSSVMKKFFVFILLVVAVLATAVVLRSSAGNFPKIDGSKWQAVFLTNNQVYFGHLRNLNSGYVGLKDVFYLQTGPAIQQGGATQPDLSLVKLGGELHGPEDFMHIPKDRIAFWENMRADSQIVSAITTVLTQQKAGQ